MSEGGSREYPDRPIVGVAGVVICGDSVLLVRRGKEPMMGSWSLPGGALKLSERVEEGVRREVCEETGVAVRPVELVEVLDRISRDESGRVRYHYVLLDWLCVPETAGGSLPRPVAGSDAEAAVWAHSKALAPFALEAATLRVIERAASRARELCL